MDLPALWQKADPLRTGASIETRDVSAADERTTRLGTKQSCKAVEQRALARPVRSEQRRHPTALESCRKLANDLTALERNAHPFEAHSLGGVELRNGVHTTDLR